MNQNDALYRLIKTLSRGEKRAVQFYLNNYDKKGENALQLLFKELNKKTSLSNQQLNQWHSTQKFKTRLSVLKSKLFKAILESISGQISFGNNPVGKIKQYSNYSFILFQRGLFKDSVNYLLKAKEVALEIQNYFELVPLIKQEQEISRHFLSIKSYEEKIKFLNEELKTAQFHIQTEWQFVELHKELNKIYRRLDKPKTQSEKIIYKKFFSNDLLKRDNIKWSRNAKAYYFNLKMFYHSISGKTETALKFAEKNANILNPSNEYDKYIPEMYLVALNNLLILNVESLNKKSFLSVLKQLDVFAEKASFLNEFQLRRIFEIKYSALLQFYLKTDEFKKGFNLKNEIINGIEKYKFLGLGQYRILRFYFNLAVTSFYADNMISAHQLVKKAIDLKDTNTSLSTLIYCRIFDLILHYQKGDYLYLANQTKNVKRYIKKQNRVGKAEQLILNFLSNAYKNSFSEKNEINILETELRKLEETEILQVLPIYKWLQHS